MKGLFTYSGLTTKIRAMQGHLLNDRNFREIVELPNVPAAVSYLKQQPSYAELFQGLEESSLHRGQIEQILHLAVYRDFSKLYRFSNLEQRKFLSNYFKRYEISILKECLNKIFDHRDVSLNLSIYQDFFDRHSQLDLALVTSSSSPEELISNLKGTEYYDPLVHLGTMENPTLFDYEMTLDLYYFSHLWKQKEKIAKKKDLEDRSYESSVDLPFKTVLSHDQRRYLRADHSGTLPSEKNRGSVPCGSGKYGSISAADPANLLCETF